MELIEQVRKEVRVLQMEKEIEQERQKKEHRHFEMHLDKRKHEVKAALHHPSFPQLLEKCRSFPW